MTELKLTDHHFARPGEQLPPVDESLLLEYVVGSNGVYARGRRPGLEVCMPVSFNLAPIRGLSEVASYAQWGFLKVPVALVEKCLEVSHNACIPAKDCYSPRETLFHLSFSMTLDCADHLLCASGWHLEWPEQVATAESVRAIDSGVGTSSERAIIELHSHHQMRAEFSPDDNADESQGFRVYAVIGTLFTQPTITARIGLFGHFLLYNASEFFELPEGLRDTNPIARG